MSTGPRRKCNGTPWRLHSPRVIPWCRSLLWYWYAFDHSFDSFLCFSMMSYSSLGHKSMQSLWTVLNYLQRILLLVISLSKSVSFARGRKSTTPSGIELEESFSDVHKEWSFSLLGCTAHWLLNGGRWTMEYKVFWLIISLYDLVLNKSQCLYCTHASFKRLEGRIQRLSHCKPKSAWNSYLKEYECSVSYL